MHLSLDFMNSSSMVVAHSKASQVARRPCWER